MFSLLVDMSKESIFSDSGVSVGLLLVDGSLLIPACGDSGRSMHPRTCILLGRGLPFSASSTHHRRSFDNLLLRPDPIAQCSDSHGVISSSSLEAGEVDAFVSTYEVGEVGE